MTETFLKKRWPDLLLFSILLVGICIRLICYVWDVSFWHDETLLAVSIVERGFSGLAGPLEYGQMAPLLFLFCVEAATWLFGDSELSLRLVPLLSGCSALVFAGLYSRKYLQPVVGVFVCSLLASSTSLLLYSVNFKQYSTELLCSIAALYAFRIVTESKRGGWLAGLIVVLLPWLSFSSVMVIAGLTVGHVLYALLQREFVECRKLIVLAVSGLLSFLVYYFIFLNQASSNPTLVGFWRDFYFEAPWLSERNFSIFRAGILYTTTMNGYFTLTLCVFGVSVIYGLITNLKDTAPCLMVLLVTLLLVGLQMYPFCERLIQFLFPFSAILMGQALHAFSRAQFRFIAAACVVVLFCMNSYRANMYFLQNTPVFQNVRGSYEYIEANKSDGEMVFLVPPYDEFSRYYDQYEFLSSVETVEDYSRSTLLDCMQSGRAFWVLSESRRADQNEFMSKFVEQFYSTLETHAYLNYEFSYVKLKRTVILYFKPISIARVEPPLLVP